MDAPIMMTKEYWLCSQLSVAKYAGGCKAFGHEYLVMPVTFDLLRTDFIPMYKKLGRERFLQMLKDNPAINDADLKRMMRDEIKAAKAKKATDAPKQGNFLTITNNEENNIPILQAARRGGDTAEGDDRRRTARTGKARRPDERICQNDDGRGRQCGADGDEGFEPLMARGRL